MGDGEEKNSWVKEEELTYCETGLQVKFDAKPSHGLSPTDTAETGRVNPSLAEHGELRVPAITVHVLGTKLTATDFLTTCVFS